VKVRIEIKIISMLLLASVHTIAQKEKKITFVGGARSTMNNNQLVVTDSIVDSTTAKRNTGGYALIDMGVNIKPNKSTEILGMFRIRNGYGGFWGSGVNFDVRQMYIKGVVANTVRYQIGDLNLKQTPFTLYNHHADAIDSLPAIFALQNSIVNYEKFYKNNTWRMQGANIDFGVTFNKGIQDLNVTGFINRVNPTNFGNVAERLMSGAVVEFVQSNQFKFAYNVNKVFDVLGTIRDSNAFKNTVQSIDAKWNTKLANKKVVVTGELGNSNYNYRLDTLAPKLNDYFAHASATIDLNKQNLKATIGYLNVGPEYRSIGTQSKDVNYNSLPVYFDRYTNKQNIRPLALLDVIGNDNIYNRTISSRLAPQNNLFNNAMPYGIATANRLGMYGRVHYKKDVDATITYYNLSEIKGEGTLALRKFSILKLNAMIPLQTYLGFNNKLELQLGAQIQNINRNSNAALENVAYKNLQTNAGIRYEIFKDFDLLAGYIAQNTNGDDFIADRNSNNEIIYFNQQKYDTKQNIKAIGVRYNFTSKIFLSTMYQQAAFTDQLKENASYNINQFSILFNMLY
jgi:hypothetical protein